jgi:hypothetical protein
MEFTPKETLAIVAATRDQWMKRAVAAEARVAELESGASEDARRINDAYKCQDQYILALQQCAAAAGIPDPADGCRTVLAIVKNVT